MSAAPAAPVTFWALSRPAHRAIAVAGGLSVLGALTRVLPVVAAVELARLLLSAPGPEVAGRAWLLVGGLALALVIGAWLTSAGYVRSHRADARFAEQLRQRQITHLLGLPLDWLSRTSSGRVKKLVQDDVTKVHQLIAHLIPDGATATVVPLTSLATLAIVDWRLALIALVPLALCVGAMTLMMRDLTAQYERYTEALGAISGSIVEFVRGIAPIKMFAADGRGHRRFREQSRAFHGFYGDWVRATVHPAALMLVFASPGFAVAVSALGASLLIARGGLAPVAILPAVLLAANIAGPVFLLAQMGQFLREANGAAGELGAFFARPVAEEPLGTAEPVGHELELDGVCFRYPDGPLAVDAVSATLPAGSVTALVGLSGSGKSTLAAMLPRLLDPDRGEIRLGGVPLGRLSAEQLYRAIGFVFQQPFLFRISVHDNIALGRPGSSREEVIAAATAAQLHDRIRALPAGYDAIVGVDARFSGGEQQRLSIARALLMDTPVLVLDEATAFADPDSEAQIQRGLARLTAGRSLLVIAHRLHTVIGADQILVMRDGAITERGSHAELLAAEGEYARLWAGLQRARLGTAPAESEPAR